MAHGQVVVFGVLPPLARFRVRVTDSFRFALALQLPYLDCASGTKRLSTTPIFSGPTPGCHYCQCTASIMYVLVCGWFNRPDITIGFALLGCAETTTPVSFPFEEATPPASPPLPPAPSVGYTTAGCGVLPTVPAGGAAEPTISCAVAA